MGKLLSGNRPQMGIRKAATPPMAQPTGRAAAIVAKQAALKAADLNQPQPPPPNPHKVG